MPSGRDKRKKAKERTLGGPVPGKGPEKTKAKTEKNATKQVWRMDKRPPGGGEERRMDKRLAGDEDDIDALLARFALEDKAKKEVTILNDCDPPSARVNASLVPYIAPKVNDLLLFGGEMADPVSNKVYVYNDLYRFNTDKQRWSRISSPNSPTPRSAHQAIVYKGTMLVWGGEFTSPNQERFMHFKDLWRLDLSTWEWDCLPTKGGPTARSGHRMALWKSKAILFGGFYDTGKEIRYYNDLWELDLTDNKWSPVGPPPSGPSGSCPSPRSGCQMVVHGDTLFIYGGYSKVADEEDGDIEHGHVHDDLWALDLTRYTWERVKKVGMAPGPRASFSLVAHRGRAFLFGGVSDNEAKGGEDLSSEFHNDLYQFSFEKRRWYAAQLKAPPAASKAEAAALAADASSSAAVGASSSTAASGPHDSAAGASNTASSAPDSDPASEKHKGMSDIMRVGADPTSAIYKAVVRIQSRFRGYVVRKAYRLYQLGGVVSEILYSPAAYGLDLSSLNMPKPRARISAQMAVVGNTLWMLGGIVEVGDREVTLDDMWSLDLAKLDGWNMIKENSLGAEAFKAGSASSSEGDDDGSGSDDD